MSLPILNYTRQSRVSGGSGFLEQLQAFATACGWETRLFIKDIAWGLISTDIYGWVSGSEQFLQIQSTGYGFQNIGYEFRLVPYGSVSDQIEWAMYDVDNADPSYSSTYHPIEQGTRNNFPTDGNAAQNACYHWFSFPRGVYPEVWFFGDERFILAVNKVTSKNYIPVSFGTLILAEECWSRTDLGFFWPVQQWGDAQKATVRWDTIDDDSGYDKRFWHAPFAFQPIYALGGVYVGQGTANTARFSGAWKSAETVGVKTYTQTTNFVPYFTASLAWATYGKFTYQQYGCGYNSWSDKYVPIVSQHFVAAGSLFYPVGISPIAWIPWRAALRPGSTMKFGAESYLTFPLFSTDSDYGFIVRVA